MTAPVGVFCDFDGTISEADLIAAIGLEFGGAGAAPIIAAVRARQMPVGAGVEALFGLIPSSAFPAVVAFARRETRVRPGFAGFVGEVLAAGWRFTVVSGGFDFFVRPVLAPLGPEVAVVCNRIDASGPCLAVRWALPCDRLCAGGCGLCKPTVMRLCRHEAERQVLIGDGVTDILAARECALVVARDRLLLACEQEGLAHLPWESFFGLMPRIQETLRLGGGRA